MLMDKTLGAPSVVNPDNVEQLFQEMLHPYLEDERKKSDEAVVDAQNKANSKIEELNRRLEQERISRSTVEKELATSYKKTVQDFCEEVERLLKSQRKFRKVIALILAIFSFISTLIVPIILSEQVTLQSWNPILTMLSIIIGTSLTVALTYSTITGAKWIGTRITSERARKTLIELADQRGLNDIIRNFEIDWQNDSFEFFEKPREP